MPPAYTSYDFRPDFADIAGPGLDRFLNTCSDLLGDAFEYEQRESYAKTFKRSLWRTLKSELRTAQIGEGVEPAPPIGSPPGPPPDIPPAWNAERAAAIAADFEADAI